jgi:hypothetical protein
MRVVAVCALGALLAACAGRSPQPVAVVQAQDRYMDCAAVIAEVKANNATVQQLADEKGLKVGQNVAAGVAGLFIPVLWFAMDWQGTQDKEITALQSRQQYLATMAEQRNCGAQQGPPSNKRAATPPPRTQRAPQAKAQVQEWEPPPPPAPPPAPPVTQAPQMHSPD